MSTEMKFRNKVIDYFTVPGHPERMAIFTKMVKSGDYLIIYHNPGEKSRKDILRDKLKIWEGVYCKEGIERARQALLPEDCKPKVITLRFTIEIDYESDRLASDGNPWIVPHIKSVSDSYRRGSHGIESWQRVAKIADVRLVNQETVT